jgi:23S rRNA (uracil1939-C5)-methyltransferase
MNEKFTINFEDQKEIKCGYFPLCSGCRKQKDLFKHEKHTLLEETFKRKIPFIVDDVVGWRHKAKLAIGKEANELKIGLYQENSHKIVNIPDCPLHTNHLNPVLNEVYSCVQKTKISIYSEKTFQGILRYVQLVEENETGKISLTFVVNADLEEIKNHPFFQELESTLKNKLVNLWLNEKKTQDNSIFGAKWLKLRGNTYHVQKILNRPFAFHPAAFCQVHLKQYENVLKKIRSYCVNKPVVLELYAGVGTIGKNMIDLARSIDCFESNPFAKECFEESQKMKFDENIQFFPKPAEEFEEKGYTLAILDPPRKGLSSKVLEKLLNLKTIEEMILLYCDADSFIKDVKIFEKNGFLLEEIETYLFFPGSDHIEVLGRIKRI